MPKRNVIIRVDGNSNIGFGHIYRCIALAEMLEDEFNLCFVTRYDSYVRPIEDAGFMYKTIIDEIEISVNTNDIVVVDSYTKNCKFLAELRSKGVILVSIEDNSSNLCDCDLIINHIISINDKKRFLAHTKELLLGTIYALLRKPFFDENKDFNSDNPILISLGNSLQTVKIIPRIIKDLRKDLSNKKISILTSKIISSKLEITDTNISCFYNLNSDEVKDLINGSSLCLITPGMISYEIFSVNRPIIIGGLTPIQRDICRIFEKHNLVNNIGSWENDKIDISNMISDNNNKIMMENQRQLFDGKSKNRILKVFESL